MASTLRASVTADSPTTTGGPATVLVDGADTPITANGLQDYTPTPGDRLLVQQVGQQVEILQFITRGTVPSGGGGGIKTYRQASAPTGLAANDDGAIWFDTSNGDRPSRWDGAGLDWVLVQDGAIATAQTAADNASTAASSAQTTANSANTAAGNAQTTANSKIRTFYANSSPAPSATSIGDLWVVTDMGNLLRRATSTGTTGWVDAPAGQQAIQTAAVGQDQAVIAQGGAFGNLIPDSYFRSAKWRQKRIDYNGSNFTSDPTFGGWEFLPVANLFTKVEGDYVLGSNYAWSNSVSPNYGFDTNDSGIPGGVGFSITAPESTVASNTWNVTAGETMWQFTATIPDPTLPVALSMSYTNHWKAEYLNSTGTVLQTVNGPGGSDTQGSYQLLLSTTTPPAGATQIRITRTETSTSTYTATQQLHATGCWLWQYDPAVQPVPGSWVATWTDTGSNTPTSPRFAWNVPVTPDTTMRARVNVKSYKNASPGAGDWWVDVEWEFGDAVGDFSTVNPAYQIGYTYAAKGVQEFKLPAPPPGAVSCNIGITASSASGQTPSKLEVYEVELIRDGDSDYVATDAQWTFNTAPTVNANLYLGNSGLIIPWDTWHSLSGNYDTGWGLGTDGAANQTYYMMDAIGQVHIIGRPSKLGGSGTSIFTLPAAYRPSKQIAAYGVSLPSQGYAVVDVNTDGTVKAYYGGTPNWISLNICFLP